MTQRKNNSFGLADILSVKDLAKALQTILHFLLAFLVLGAFAYLITRTPVTLEITRNSLLMAGIIVLAMLLLRAQRISQAVLLVILASGMVLLAAAWYGVGVMGPAYMLCGLLVMGTTMYWGQRAGLITTAILGLAGLGLLAAGHNGWLLNISRPVTDWMMWAILISDFTLTALLMGLVLRYLENLVSQVRQELSERTQAEEEIRRLNVELEERVVQRTAKLAQSEHLLKTITRNIQDVIWTTDLQLKTTYSTDSAARLRGFSMDELQDEPLQKALTPESFKLATQALQDEIADEKDASVDPNRSRVLQLEYYRKDGSTVPVEVRTSVLRDENGQIVGLTGVSRDVRERQWMEKALLDSEERYRKINSVISDYSYSAVIDAQGNFSPEWVAGAFAEITGYEFDEYKAYGGWENLLHPNSCHQDELDRAALSANRPVEGSELRIIRKDGETRWVRNFAHPVWNKAENRLAGVYGGVQDITFEKQATERLKALNDELEKRVAERTTKLENALAEIESFSYSISHDLRAPLRAVNGYAGILLSEYRQELAPPVVEKLVTIQENGKRMGQLVDGLLQFLRSGSGSIERQEVNPSGLIQAVLKRLGPQYKNRNIEFQIDNLPACSANPPLLEKVFEGLISNAIKFTRNKQRAHIQVGALQKETGAVYFVRDNGVGFDMKYYDKLFGVFQRLHHASEFEGIGASLAITQRIINRHNGRIWAEAEAGKGATFYFTLG